MILAQMLEDFDQYSSSQTIPYATEDSIEEVRLSGFEKGYQAGWDDASRAISAERSHISSELARNLIDLSVSYQEACDHVIYSMKPLLTALVETVLPSITKNTLGIRVVSEVLNMAREHSDSVFVLTVAPESHAKIATLMDDGLLEKVNFIEDSSLGEGQVYLKLGNDERIINFEALYSEAAAALDGFFLQLQK